MALRITASQGNPACMCAGVSIGLTGALQIVLINNMMKPWAHLSRGRGRGGGGGGPGRGRGRSGGPNPSAAPAAVAAA